MGLPSTSAGVPSTSTGLGVPSTSTGMEMPETSTATEVFDGNDSVFVRKSADRDRELIQNNQKVTIIHCMNFNGSINN